MNRVKVLMLGPSLYQQGGMATVEMLIVNQPFKEVNVQHISTHEEGSMSHRLRVFSIAFFQFVKMLLLGDVDIVHLHVSEKGSVVRNGFLALVAKLFRKPVVLHTHGCEFHVFFEALPSVGKAWVSWFFRQCSYVITLSESWKSYYINSCQLQSERVVVLHNPVELPDTLPARYHSNPVKFAFLGRIGQRKGAFDLIRAFAQLPTEQQQRSQLSLAGDGEVEAAQSLVQSLGLSDRVHFLGWINPTQRNQLLAESDVFFLPSYNEGLPVAMLEAMAWGLPVVVSPVGGIPDIVTHGKNGMLVSPGDIPHITRAMQTLIENVPTRLRLGLNARRRVAPLDMQYYGRVLLSIYRSAIMSDEYASDSDLQLVMTRIREELGIADFSNE